MSELNLLDYDRCGRFETDLGTPNHRATLRAEKYFRVIPDESTETPKNPKIRKSEEWFVLVSFFSLPMAVFHSLPLTGAFADPPVASVASNTR